MKELKRRSAEQHPTVWVGRNGLTKAILGQISAQLKAKEIIKVKVHKTSLERTELQEIVDKTADETQSQILDVRGRTFTVYKPKKPGRAQTKVEQRESA
jgi:putative YhbY family RNA-binding protein